MTSEPLPVTLPATRDLVASVRAASVTLPTLRREMFLTYASTSDRP